MKIIGLVRFSLQYFSLQGQTRRKLTFAVVVKYNCGLHCHSKIQLWFTSYTLSLVSILSDKANKVRAFFKILCWAINILLFLSDRSCIFYYF